jgi:hypothetical protein
MIIKENRTRLNKDSVRRSGTRILISAVAIAGGVAIIWFVATRLWDIFTDPAPAIAKAPVVITTEEQAKFLDESLPFPVPVKVEPAAPVVDAAKIAAEVAKLIKPTEPPQNDRAVDLLLQKARTETEKSQAAEKRAKELGEELKRLTLAEAKHLHDVKQLKESIAKNAKVKPIKCETTMAPKVMQSMIKAQGKCTDFPGYIEVPGVDGFCRNEMLNKSCFLKDETKIGKNKKGQPLVIKTGKYVCN